jgi:long-chain fatty acid transport protein
MLKKSCAKKIMTLSIMSALSSFSSHVFASDFNIPFVNASGLGNLYSGWAAEADDASTAFTNPAGLIRIQQQQLVFAAVGVTGNTQFTGSATSTYSSTPQSGSASSKLNAFLPSFYYAWPVSDKIALGFSETVPFGLGTSYNKDSLVRYAATTTRIGAIDLGPSIGIKLTDKLSGGFGLDVDHLTLTMNNMIGSGDTATDAESQNQMSDWGYGWHAGLLYQFTPATRVGLTYSSPIVFHPSGTSTYYANNSGAPSNRSTVSTSMTLPRLAQLSLYHDLNSRWAVMGTVFYANWRVAQQLILNDIAVPASTITATTPLNYHNTLDYSAGVNFKVDSKWMLRAGAELWQTPTNDTNRIVGDPIGTATIVGIGAHYQQNRDLGYDVGYEHGFFNQTKFNYAAQGTATTVTGHSDSYTNIFGAQLTWNLS